MKVEKKGRKRPDVWTETAALP